MRLPVTLLAGVIMIASPAFAQPTKHDLPKASRPSAKHAQVVLASADTHPAAPALAPSSPEPRHPAPRITHCRCGDPQPDEGTPEQ